MSANFFTISEKFKFPKEVIIIAAITASVSKFLKNFKNSFENMNRISFIILISGQLFILIVLLASLIYNMYTVYIAHDLSALYDLLKTDYILYDNAALSLCIIWIGSFFIDYIDKNKEKL